MSRTLYRRLPYIYRLLRRLGDEWRPLKEVAGEVGVSPVILGEAASVAQALGLLDVRRERRRRLYRVNDRGGRFAVLFDEVERLLGLDETIHPGDWPDLYMLRNLLRCLEGEPRTVKRVAWECRLSYSRRSRHLEVALGLGLVREAGELAEFDRVCFTLTSRGRRLLDLLEAVDEMLEERRRGGRERAVEV